MAQSFAALSAQEQLALVARSVEHVVNGTSPPPADAWATGIVRQALAKELDRASLGALTLPLAPPHSEAFADALYARYPEARHALVLRSTQLLSRAHLSDVDWKMNVTVGSDRVSGVRTPLLVLQLALKRPDGTTEALLLELPPADLDALLASLAPAHAAVQQLRV